MVMNLFSLEGKTALVTGAAAGIGQAIAVAYAKAGAHLLLLGHRDNLGETKKLVEVVGGMAEEIILDLQEVDSIKSNYQSLLSEYEIDILVNNAGIIRREPALEYSRENWDAVMDTNINSVFVLSQEVAKGMMERKSGKIINIASLLSFQGGVFVPAYTASKHAIQGLTKAFANEWAKYGIQVNAIAPGYIATNNTKALRDDEARNSSILERIPTGRWGRPEDLTGAAIYLASEASDYVTGHTLVVDGGWMAR
ncbi:2-dehydro-3-deoxy-D-gluconate 5-dehydrogenase KduD [Bacillus tianshenii]|uniref:2-dehydro-3-deoxy-D-gluconate 5-dehydrogenase KduD n=1 Tax=Sutcliffiella tianshenii TaxID=1463404 RepID=UPI001CD52EE3|nr:2-dehydro-3-deoxy-D-gluconate 5-dehydrogenase KduD [Bacillus tianshenii]MCA1321667.1 2-dehydro-3-deoxy-D-gluconate 5-dehydrogenase KduD [Bacillus tianshenii]